MSTQSFEKRQSVLSETECLASSDSCSDNTAEVAFCTSVVTSKLTGCIRMSNIRLCLLLLFVHTFVVFINKIIVIVIVIV